MLKYILSNAKVFIENEFISSNILISNDLIVSISQSLPPVSDSVIFDFNNCIILPGLIDVHVHLREPGFSYKETIESGTKAAAHGGVTSVLSMPNVSPTPDNLDSLAVQLDLIKKEAKVNVYPYGAISQSQNGEELSDFDNLANSVVAFSDDGRGVQSNNLMLSAMVKAKSYNKIIAAHCEDNSLLNGGYIFDGEYARLHKHKGISSESEWKQIERDLELVRQTGCAYHICHISTKESVELIRQAKKDGLDVTCETAPHYLAFNDMDLIDDGRFKMNPPIRSEKDRQALLEGVKDGTIDMIATDHAPHSSEEKSKGLKGSLMGVVGIEISFAVMYTNLVKTNIITLEKLIELMQTNPRKRFKIGTSVEVGQKADLTVFNLNEKYIIDSKDFLSKGKATPFEKQTVFGKCKATFVNGRIIWQDSSTEK